MERAPSSSERSPMRNQAAIQKREREERREHMLARRRQRSQMRQNTEVQQETKLGDMENNYKMDEFALLTLQRNLRCELRDRKVKLTQVGSEGRVKLEVQEDALTYILDQLQGKKAWSCEKEQMEKEIHGLKAQLNKGQSNVHSSNTESEYMKSQIQALCRSLSQALDNLDVKTSYSRTLEDTLQKMNEDMNLKLEETKELESQLIKCSEMLKNTKGALEKQISNSKDVQVKFEKVEAENKGLQREVEAMKLEVGVEKQLRAMAEHNAETTTLILKLQHSDKETEFEARTKAELLEANLVYERAQVQKLQERLGKKEEALLEQKEDAKKFVERTQAFHQAQLEEHKEETRKIASALKKAEDLLETECLCWQQEKPSLLEEIEKSRALYVAQLDKQKHKNDTIVAALKSMNSNQIEWLEEQKSLIQKGKEAMERAKASHQAQLEECKEETRKITSALKKAEDLLETECLRWQQEKTSLLEEIEKSRALHVAQLDEQKHKNITVIAALKNIKQQLNNSHFECKELKNSLIQKAKEAMERCQAFHQAQLEEHIEETMKIASALKKAEDLLETECLCWQQEKTSLLEEMEKSRALHVAQLDEQKHKNDTLVAALKSMNSNHIEWLEKNTSLIQATGDFKKTLQDMQQEVQEAIERSKDSHQAQLEEHKEETRKIASALKKAEDLLETECLCWQQEKTSLLEEMEKSRALHVAQLDEQKHKNDTLVAALKSMNSNHIEWLEKNTSLIQATGDFKKTLQDMQQEVQEAIERSKDSHQAQLEEHKEETRKIASALKKAEDLLETECLRWQQEKTSLLEEMEKSRALYVAQLDKQKHKNDILVAALKSMNDHHIEWLEEQKSLNQKGKEAIERSEASHQAQLEEHKEETMKIASALKKAEDLLETECLCWQQEKTSLLEEMEKSRALHVAQLDEQKHKNDTLVAALKSMNSNHIEWLEENTSLIQATGDIMMTVQDMQQEVQEAIERSKASHQAQLEGHKEETRKIASALKKAEDLLETECLCWQREKTSLLEEIVKSRALHVAQLDEQKHKNDTLMAGLRNVEQELQGHQLEWQELKTSLIQATEDLKETPQEKEQEQEEEESSMKSQLEDVMSQKQKWFRKFF